MFKKQIGYSANRKKYNSFNHEIERFVPSNIRVLDIGCSTGKLAQALKRKHCTIVGIDIDEVSLKQATKYCQKTFKIDLDNLEQLHQKLEGEKFDCIICGDILEHLKYPGILLYHLHRYLTPNGLVIASIPNSAFFRMRARFLFGNLNYDKTGLMDEDHLRFFSFKTARLLFEESNYTIENIRGAVIGKSPIRNFILRNLSKIFPTLFFLHIIIIAKKRTT